jgi:hypothetical protein
MRIHDSHHLATKSITGALQIIGNLMYLVMMPDGFAGRDEVAENGRM